MILGVGIASDLPNIRAEFAAAGVPFEKRVGRLAGRHIGPVSGPAYVAAKHGMVAMSHTINLEECQNGIRSSVLCPGEVATPILINRPVPETPETMARMLQPQDMGALIVFIARQPPHVCINEVLISPTHNRGYIGAMQALAARAGKR